MAIPKKAQTEYIMFRVTPLFKRNAERAAVKAGISTLSEFCKQAVAEKAETVGVKIDRMK